MKRELSLDLPGIFARIAILLFLSILFFTGFRACHRSGQAGVQGGTSQLAPNTPAGGGAGSGKIVVLALSKSPKHVRQTIGYLKSVKHFNPQKGFRGGRIFKNREGILPKGKTYYEYDVHPFVQGASRGAERVVTDQSKSIFYYTRDHYNTFIKIIE